MKSYARILALLLAVIMMVSVFAGCADTPASSTDPSSSEPASSEPASSEPASSEPASSEPASSEPASSEPATSEPVEPSTSVVEPDVKDPTQPPKVTESVRATATPTKKVEAEKVVDLGGFTLRIRSTTMKTFLDNKSPDKYDKDIQDRINAVAKKYNFKIVTTNCVNEAAFEDHEAILKAVQSGSKTIGHFVVTSVPLGLAGYVQGIYQDLNKIDKSTGFDAKDSTRFWQDMSAAATHEGAQYGVAIISGSQNLTPGGNGIFWMFNRNVVKQGGYSAEALYKLVREYKWTLDEATKVMEACYVPDANGDGAPEVWGLVSYKRQHKYYIQLDGGSTVRKVNGKYTYTASDDNVMSVLNWLQEVYVTKKIANGGLGASAARETVRDGKTAFLQCAHNYITQKQYIGANEAAYVANVGILPSPVGSNQIKKKVYINPTTNSKVFSMPATIKGDEKTKAATAFAAMCKAVNSVEENVQRMINEKRLNDADMIDMYKNYLIKNADGDLGYISETVGTSGVEPISVMVLDVTTGKYEPKASVEKHAGKIQSQIDKIFRQ